MKTEIIEIEPVKKQEIDWSKRMLVKAEDGTIVATTGKRNGFDFEGMQMSGNNVFVFLTCWSKPSFTPITEPITIKFIPDENP